MNNSECLLRNKDTESRTGLIWIKGGADVVLVFFSVRLVERDITNKHSATTSAD